MSDSLSEADRIRNKRLAKLSNPTSTSSSAAASSESLSNSNNPSPSRSPTPQQPPSEAKTPPRTTQQPQFPEGKRIKITPVTTIPERSRSSAPSTPGTPTSSKTESIETFEDRTLCAVFRLTLKEEGQNDLQGPRVFLPSLHRELSDTDKELRISTAVLDQALLEAASQAGGGRPLDYLLPCWKRIAKLHKGFRRSSDNDPKFQIICEARRLCMSYCMFGITMPEMFGTSNSSTLAPYLLLEPDDEKGVDFDFINESVKRFEEDDGIKPAFIAAVEELSTRLSTMDLNGDFKPYAIALRNLVRHPVIATAITESQMFNASNASADPAKFEKTTLLGPWFSLSPLQKNVVLSYFSSPKTRDQGYIMNAQRSIRMTQQMVSTDLLDIINHMIRASKDARDQVLDWFATALNINHKRRAMRVDAEKVSSDGFMFNITTCLDQLCEPFMDASFTKIDRIDAEYLHRDSRVDMRDETKINADQQVSDAFYSKKVEGVSNFITEVFFLTVAAHQYGSESLTSKLEQLDKDVRQMDSVIAKFELERPRWAGNPMQQQFERKLEEYKGRRDYGMALKYSLQGVLFDEMWQSRSMLFMRYVTVWLLRLVSRGTFPKDKITLPLPEEQLEVFKCLPEYFLEVIVSNFKFIMWCMPQIITATQGDELVMMCISFLECTSYIKNPYLKAGLVSILYRGTWNRPGGARGVLVDLLTSMSFANEYLLHAVMRFYIEAEHTGTHTQFFDKFNIRYEIFQIIKCIWPNTLYREKLSIQASQNLDFFVKFVNLLLNDVTYVLDESFGAFKTINTTQQELAREGHSMEATIRQEREEHLATAQRSAKSYMQLTNETVAMLKLFTEALADSFTMPEIVQRLADMLDYNLDAMVGPKSSNLRVDNLQEYGFNPRALLSEITDVYLNLMSNQNFITAVARDGRSYKPANFDKAADILRKWSLKSPEQMRHWSQLQKKVVEAKAADEQEEEDLGEVPDEFLDPLMFTLMEDPVILPASRISIDRSTLRSHLLSDPHDPFNRVPLTMEDVIPDTELKAKIAAFKAEKTGRGSSQMDTSSG